MKTKIFSSALSLAVAGAFWACNDDSVITIASAEQGAGVEASSSSKTKDDKSAKSSSSEDVIVVHKSSASKATDPSSSAVVPSESDNMNPNSNVISSSSVELIIISGRSSSSVTVIDNPVASSASIVVPVTGLGSCAPAKNPINKGESVQWRFSGNLSSGFSAIEFAKAHYDWAFTANAVPQVSSGPTSAAVTYVTSGVESAALKVTMPNGAEEVIMCSPLQVNGDPITGCACNASATTIDYTAEPSVSWAVTGCTSASNIISYTWDGVEGTATFTKAFDAPAASYAPTLKVANEDNTVIDVACQAVRATEGPEFLVTDTERFELPAGESNVVFDLPSGWHGGLSDEGSCTLYCTGQNEPIVITVGLERSTESYATYVSIPVSQTINKSKVVIGLTGAARCSVEW